MPEIPGAAVTAARHRSMNPPPPWGTGVPDRNSRTCKLQSLSRLRTLCRASPKNTSPSHSGPKLPDFFGFLVIFRTSKIVKISPSSKPSQKAISMGPCRPLGRPKSPFCDFGTDFGVILGAIFHKNFHIFRKKRKTRRHCNSPLI